MKYGINRSVMRGVEDVAPYRGLIKLTAKSKFETKAQNKKPLRIRSGFCITFKNSYFYISSELCFDLFKAICADALVVKVNNIVGVAAENAGGLIFLENDLIVIGKDLNGIFDVDIHNFSDLDGKNDSSELVYFSYDSC